MTTNEPMKHASVDLPESLHRAAKVKLASEGKTFNDLVREAVTAYVGAGTSQIRQPRSRPTKQ